MTSKIFQWAVVGAGPAGIAAVGKLLDAGIPAADIVWLDPFFKAGDLGQLWCTVSSNTTVGRFLDFLQGAESFSYKNADIDFPLNHLPLDSTCILREIVKPLQWTTLHLREKVCTQTAMIHRMDLAKRTWFLYSDLNTYCAKNVILATGAVPTTLNYPHSHIVPFNIAIDKERLANFVKPHERIAVFGSSHSAIIIIRYLVELGIKKIINFYRSPTRYAINMGDWILFDNTGLKGETARWARENIDGILPDNLVRYYANESNITTYLSQCNRIIYAVGFEKRKTISIADYDTIHHNPHLGIIGPGLFGLGIAYPEIKADPYGNVEAQVGLWKFMKYLTKVLPVWLKYPT